MVGIITNIMTDYESDVKDKESEEEKRNYPHKLRGDLCAISGGILYGVNNVLTEVTVTKTGDNTEYLGMMGLLAFMIALTQSLLLEWDDILEFFGEDEAHSSSCSIRLGWWLYFVFVGVTILSYTGSSRFLIESEAAFFSLSLLTGDLWSVVFSIVAERIVPQPLFFFALIFVLSGVILYEMAPSPADDKHQGSQGETRNSNNDGIMHHQSTNNRNPSSSRRIFPPDIMEEDDDDHDDLKQAEIRLPVKAIADTLR
jgi:solute carrier family 35 protein F1/2